MSSGKDAFPSMNGITGGSTDPFTEDPFKSDDPFKGSKYKVRYCCSWLVMRKRDQ